MERSERPEQSSRVSFLGWCETHQATYTLSCSFWNQNDQANGHAMQTVQMAAESLWKQRNAERQQRWSLQEHDDINRFRMGREKQRRHRKDDSMVCSQFNTV